MFYTFLIRESKPKHDPKNIFNIFNESNLLMIYRPYAYSCNHTISNYKVGNKKSLEIIDKLFYKMLCVWKDFQQTNLFEHFIVSFRIDLQILLQTNWLNIRKLCCKLILQYQKEKFAPKNNKLINIKHIWAELCHN